MKLCKVVLLAIGIEKKQENRDNKIIWGSRQDMEAEKAETDAAMA